MAAAIAHKDDHTSVARQQMFVASSINSATAVAKRPAFDHGVSVYDRRHRRARHLLEIFILCGTAGRIDKAELKGFPVDAHLARVLLGLERHTRDAGIASRSAATHAPVFAPLPGRVGIHQVLETQKLKVAREQEQQGK